MTPQPCHVFKAGLPVWGFLRQELKRIRTLKTLLKNKKEELKPLTLCPKIIFYQQNADPQKVPPGAVSPQAPLLRHWEVDSTYLSYPFSHVR